MVLSSARRNGGPGTRRHHTFSDATIPQSFAYNGYCDQLTDSIRVNTTGFPIEENYAIYGRNSGYIRTASSEKKGSGGIPAGTPPIL